MLATIDLLKLEVIVPPPKLGVASSHGVGSFQQVVPKVAVTGFYELGVLSLELTELMLRPDETSELGDGGLRPEPVNVADLGDDAGGVDLADDVNGCTHIGDDLKLLRYVLVLGQTGESTTSRIRIIPGQANATALTAKRAALPRQTASEFAANFRLRGTDFM